jgi:hypothetical protein
LTIRVVIADDSLLVREGIASLLRRAGFDVAAETATPDELLEAVEAHRPEIAIVERPHAADPHRGGPRGGARDPRPPSGDGDRDPLPARRGGIAMRVLVENPERLGYLLKDRVIDPDDFAATLRHAASGWTSRPAWSRSTSARCSPSSGFPTPTTTTAGSWLCSPSFAASGRHASRDAPQAARRRR